LESRNSVKRVRPHSCLQGLRVVLLPHLVKGTVGLGPPRGTKETIELEASRVELLPILEEETLFSEIAMSRDLHNRHHAPVARLSPGLRRILDLDTMKMDPDRRINPSALGECESPLETLEEELALDLLWPVRDGSSLHVLEYHRL